MATEKELADLKAAIEQEEKDKKNKGKTVSDLKGVSDLKTAMTAHLRSKPAVEGEEYLHLYLAGKENVRLGKLTKVWEKQKRRTMERHVNLRKDIVKLESTAGVVKPTGADSLAKPSPGQGQPTAPDSPPQKWKTMPLEY